MQGVCFAVREGPAHHDVVTDAADTGNIVLSGGFEGDVHSCHVQIEEWNQSVCPLNHAGGEGGQEQLHGVHGVVVSRHIDTQRHTTRRCRGLTKMVI